MALNIKPKITPAVAKRWWKKVTSGCDDTDIALMSNETYWETVREANEQLAAAGDLHARAAIADYHEWVACREFLEYTILRGTWSRGADGEYLIRTSAKARIGGVVTVSNAKGETRRYTLTESVEPGLWKWRGL